MIQASTLDFLTELKHHNTKEWFDEHRHQYDEAKQNFIQIVDQALQEIVQIDEDIHEIEAKKYIFRINRDVRFSKDKSPYKTHLSAFISKGGRSTDYAGYYFHLEPGASMIAGGTYMPASPMLKKIRHHIDFNAPELRNILANEEFNSFFGELRGEQLKTAPKGYPKDHADIDLLRFKGFIVSRDITENQELLADFPQLMEKGIHLLRPFNKFLNDGMDAGL